MKCKKHPKQGCDVAMLIEKLNPINVRVNARARIMIALLDYN
jgi:hypothetical protein